MFNRFDRIHQRGRSDRDPLTGASNAGGVGINSDRRRYSWLSIDDVLDLRTTSATIRRAVYRTYGDAIFITTCSMHDHDKEKRTDFFCTQR